MSEKTLSPRPRVEKHAAAETPTRRPSAGKPQNLQDDFLNLLHKNKMPVTMFLVKEVKLQGIIT